MCDKMILENGGMLKFITDCYKNHKMCNKAVYNYSYVLEFVPCCYNTQKIIIKLSLFILIQCNLFLNPIRLKSVIKLFMLVFFFLYLMLFLINKRLKKYAIKLFLKNVLCQNITLIDTRISKICDKDVDVFSTINV